ncbi:MAG: hypothetical protein HDR23_09510 [Lachnospiraceae bacterium]|nr:hypothetical protein [Lachnospiraceae bacterium]
MKKIVYKSRAIQAIVVIIAAILLVSLWPFRIWHENVTTSVGTASGVVTDVINEEITVQQTIVAQYDHMDTIRLYLGDGCSGEKFYVRILNDQWQQVCEELVIIDHEKLPGYQEVMIDINMEVNQTYFIILQGEDSEIFAGCEYVPLEDMPYLGTMYYNQSSVDGMSLVADYNYGVPLRKTKVLILGLVILLSAALLVLATHLYYRKKEDRLITVEKAFKYTMNPLAAMGTAVSLAAVLTGTLGHYALDNSVYFISILFLSAVLFYGINHNRDGQEAVFTMDYLKTHLGDLFQSVCVAGAVAGCCEYMSGLYDIHHSVAERKEMLWFALAVIAMFKWKEIVNIYNGVYLAAAGVYGYHYYQTHLRSDMDDMNRQVLKYTVWIAILLGLIVIRTVIGLCKKKLTRPSYLYAGLLAVFFALIIIFRNGRWWGIVMAAAFTLFYLNYGMWEHRERLLVNIARGVALQFIWATGYCLLHRPYVTFRNARYTHIFHTVTITASYLTMVECVAVVILLSKLFKSRKLRDIWKELCFFGVVSSYMMFTMARTAFFAAGVMVLSGIVIAAAGKGKERLFNMGKNLGIMILTVLVALPVTFTIQRNVPVFVSDPFLYEIEYSMYCPEDVMRGVRPESKNFMRVGRFIDVFSEKIFGLPEGTFDVYGEIEEYKRTHMDAEDVASLFYEPEALDEMIPQDAQKEDMSNGRFDIFRSYIEQLNMTGHEEMGAILKDGEIATHAHNIYLQVAYDHGIFVGIVFVLVGIATLVSACLYYHRKKETITYALLPVVITVAVAAAGMVEWIYHLSHPCGLLLMLVITPLIFKEEK